MGNISHAVKTALFSGIPLLIMWNMITIAIIVSQKIYLNRAKKFCEKEDTLHTTGTVTDLITRTSGDSNSPNYYVSYVFYTANGKQFTGEYGIENREEYQKGLSINICYDRTDPTKNISTNEIAYKMKLVRTFYKVMLYGSLALLGIAFIVFLVTL